MLSSLAYKEWLKLRYVFWVPFLFIALALGDALITFRHVNEIIGPLMLWLDAVFYDKVFFDSLLPAGVFCGIWTALFQFVPECQGKRLRLLFHLPVRHRVSLYFIIFTGLLICSAGLLVSLGGLSLLVAHYLPREMVIRSVLTALPWMLASYPAYLGTVLLIVEPLWTRKFLLGILTVLFLKPFFASEIPGAYQHSILSFALLTLLWLFPLDVLANRFKRGARW
ncbi:hypothetical protein LWC08_01940 [Desulfobaculum bizertense]|uniref:hypothetical protein n=1 Tax=Desulfobaculum bizertense TaxID=376490 RepID=UPI001F22FCEE|nr:hypothetical protein [Desulfobaculum bizertense]UIJ38351.1 hypothetical protein LWC08_01940 [Desulfobaculum bizertense]